MHTIQDIVKFSNLKDAFVRRCIRDMNDILSPYIERGEKNRLLLDPEIIPIFAYIKQDKDKGLSLSTIKRNLLNSDIQLKKDMQTINEELEANYQTLPKSTKDHNNNGEWLSIKDAAKLSEKSEATVRRLVNKLKNTDASLIKKNKDKWHVKRHIVLEHFNIDDQANLRTHISNHDNALHTHTPNHDDDLYRHMNNHMDSHEDNLPTHNKQNTKDIIDLFKKQIDDLNTQIAELKEQLSQKDAQLEKQIAELKEQLGKKDIQIENLAIDFKEQLSQKDQQIHQLHVLLKESKTSTIDYKPDENLGVFSKVLVKFGL